MTKKKDLAHEVGSGNVFADLGLPDSGELKLKSNIAFMVNREIEKRGLKQKDVAALLNITQPQVSSLSKGKLYRFSVEKLLHLFLALGQDVEIVIKKKPRNRQARIQVKAA
jgi:predicted XRE-type DNA-binding protein